MTPSNDDHPATPPPLPFGFEASLTHALTEAGATDMQLALVLSEWGDLQARHVKRTLNAFSVELSETFGVRPSIWRAARPGPDETADLLRQAVRTVEEREGLPGALIEAIRAASVHVEVGDDVAGVLMRTTLNLSEQAGRDWPEGSLMASLRDHPEKDASTVLFDFAIGDPAVRKGLSGEAASEPRDVYGFRQIGERISYAVPSERVSLLREAADQMAATMLARSEPISIAYLAESRPYPVFAVLLDGLVRAGGIQVHSSGSVEKLDLQGCLDPLERSWLVAAKRGQHDEG